MGINNPTHTASPSGAAGGDLTGNYPNPTIVASVSLTTPAIGVATGTSLALGGATLGGNALAVTGTTLLSSTITQTLGSIAADTPFLTGTVTWNNSATIFTGIKTNTINTASDGNSTIIDLQVNSTSQFKVNRSGDISVARTVNAVAATAIPAGGTAGSGFRLFTAQILITAGSGVPTLAAPIGSIYTRSDASVASTRVYVATSSSGAWTNITTAT